MAKNAAPRTTLRARMTVVVTVLCLSALTMAGVATYFGALAALRQNLDDALLSIARAEIASAVDEPGGKVHVHEEPRAAIQLPSGSGYEKFAQIENPADKIIARTSNLRNDPLQGEWEREKQARAGHVSFGDLKHGNEKLRVIYYPLHDTDGHPLITLCAISMTNMEESLATLRNTLLVMLTVSGILAALGTNFIAQRLTSPLEQMTQEALAIDEDCLSTRLSVPTQDAELYGLATVLNAMLTRLEAAFTTQKRFLTDASHELRSPLANLRAMLEVALRRPRTSEEYEESLRGSLTEVERLSRLVNHLMTLSRAESGQFALHFTPCDLVEIAEHAVAAHRARAEERNLGLVLHTEESLVINADADRIRQILDNLLDNALRYAPGGTRVEVTVRHEKNQALVTVLDAGQELAAEDQERIFDRFYRADESRTRSTGGLGLGLAIARTFAEAHHGNLSVQSAPERGNAFILLLPLPHRDALPPDTR